MVKKTTTFMPADRLRLLIEENPHLLGVMSRFGMSFGFGDKTVCAACAQDGVDMDTFLAVSNLICNRNYSRFDISLPALMGYLRKAHSHFLDFLLPSIRRKLIEAINGSDVNDVAFLLLKFFDDYVAEVNKHMQHENNEVFSYATKLLAGEKPADFRITDYSLNHVSMAQKLTDLKDIFIRHYHVRDNEILTSALLDIIYCGNELHRHCEIENKLFIPAVEHLEKSLKIIAREKVDNAAQSDDSDVLVESMTEREKEILCCVAKGMANKEIASHLCLSVHTVNTYRRNISSKLQIHSAAGLTIFAILHNLIDIKEVNPHI
ncbi:MAG: response regulator transcription factor [Bacteroides sp.]|nr:response regulator transcription factor [Bacteroides sp.]MBD5347587.1 response regulator transcription factor [Bacteroides sp.]